VTNGRRAGGGAIVRKLSSQDYWPLSRSLLDNGAQAVTHACSMFLFPSQRSLSIWSMLRSLTIASNTMSRYITSSLTQHVTTHFKDECYGHSTAHVQQRKLSNTRSSAIADKPPDACACRSSMLCCKELPSSEWLQFIYLFFSTSTDPFPIWCPQWGDPFELSGSCRCGKTRMTGLQSGEGRMMIDSVVWAQYINMTVTQTRRHSKYRAITTDHGIMRKNFANYVQRF